MLICCYLLPLHPSSCLACSARGLCSRVSQLDHTGHVAPRLPRCFTAGVYLNSLLLSLPGAGMLPVHRVCASFIAVPCASRSRPACGSERFRCDCGHGACCAGTRRRSTEHAMCDRQRSRAGDALRHGVLPERGVDPRACDTCHACTCRNILKPGDLDEKLMQRIHSEPEDQVMHALRLYAERVPADCRNHSAFFTSLLNNARSQLANGGGPGGYGGPMHGRMPPRGMMPPHMMMPGMPGQMRPPFRGPPGPPMMRPPFGSPGRGMPSPGKGAYRGGGGGGPRDFTQEQMAEGVRVDVRSRTDSLPHPDVDSENFQRLFECCSGFVSWPVTWETQTANVLGVSWQRGENSVRGIAVGFG